MVKCFLGVRFRLLSTIGDFARILGSSGLLFRGVPGEEQVEGKVLPVEASKRFDGSLCRILVERARIWISRPVWLLGDVIGPCGIAVRIGGMYIGWKDWIRMSGQARLDCKSLVAHSLCRLDLVAPDVREYVVLRKK